MNSNMLFLLAFLGGNGLNPQLVQAMMDMQKESFERWRVMLKALGAIATTGIFVLRGMPVPKDAQGNPTFTNEALSAQMKASFEEGKREAFWVSLVNGVVDAILEFLKPSSSQTALMTALLARPAMSSTTVVSQTPALPASTTFSQIAPTTRTAGQVLRAVPGGMVRAQAVYFNPNTGEMAFE